MKKVVSWGTPKITSRLAKRTFKDEFAKALDRDAEQQEAVEYLQKAQPLMVALLEHKLRTLEPLLVMRPLQYQTSEIPGEEEDGFYNVRKSEASAKYKDVIKTIYPGTKLMFKALDTVLQEFVFEDGKGKEHAINFVDRDRLMTQTDIFETVKMFLANKENEK